MLDALADQTRLVSALSQKLLEPLLSEEGSSKTAKADDEIDEETGEVIPGVIGKKAKRGGEDLFRHQVFFFLKKI